MSKKVLIIDDEMAAAEAMAEMCTSMGLEPTICTQPGEAVKIFGNVVPDLVIIDLFLPGTDGMKLGQRLRGAGGENTAMLAVSGVMKAGNVSRDVWNSIRADFLPKPFELADFQAKVATRLGLPPPGQQRTRRAPKRPRAKPAPQARPFRTDLRQEPAYRLFTRLYEQRATGHLDLTRGKARRRVTFHMGQIRFANSNVSRESVGGMQVADGSLTEDAFRAAVAHARDNRIPLADALVKTGAMDRRTADRALAAQVSEVATACIGWADGQAEFAPDQAGAQAVPDHRLHPLRVVVDGVRRFYGPDTVRGFLQGKKGAYVHRSELMDREEYTLRQASPGETLIREITGHATLGNVLDAAREEDLSLLFALVATGLAKLALQPQVKEAAPSDASAPPATSGPPAAAPTMAAQAPTGDPDAGIEFTADEKQARREIRAEAKRQEEATHYEVLGLTPSCNADDVKAAYLDLARKWHSDRFAGMDLGSVADTLEDVFTRIGQAKEILEDADQRKDYDIFLDRKAQGLPTDVAIILKAEETFQQGERLMKAGKAQQALALFSQAIEMNHAEPEFHAWRAYALYRVEGSESAEEAIEAIKNAIRERENLAVGYYFLGMIAASEGDLDTAERRLRRALEVDENHGPSQQQLRVLHRRREKEEKSGGLLGRFLKK